MSDSPFSDPDTSGMTREEQLSAAFAQMVIQMVNMALMFLGRVAHPQTGKTMRDLETAKVFIDQLEMIEVKTKGNLTKDEEGLLKQSLMSLHLAFVEAVESPEPPPAAPTPEPAASKPAPQPAAAPTDAAPAPAAGTEKPSETAAEDSKKKFTKKY